MVRKRIMLEVWVDEDEYPGPMDSPVAAAHVIQKILTEAIPASNPNVHAHGRR